MEDNFNREHDNFSEEINHGTSTELYSGKIDDEREEYDFRDMRTFNRDDYDVKNNRKGIKAFLVSVIIILTLLVIALVSYIIYSLKGDANNIKMGNVTGDNAISGHIDEFNGESAIKFESKPQDTNEYTAESIYEVVAPSVVGVVVYDSNADIIADPASEGSGIIINERGYIVTNSHVVGNSKQNSIKIVLHDGEELTGKVIGYDTKTDIAVIKTDKTDLKAATFGNSDEAKVGSSVLALGNPLGLDFAGSLTKGIISAVNRSSGGSAKSLVKYIQTDTAINPGNSGGPLLNMYGQVIGVNSAKIALPNCEGMGFAIPSNTVKSIVDDIIAKGYVSGRVRLGLAGKMLSNYQSQMYNVPIGFVVSEISSDSNLRQAGVQVGDIITKVNDVTVTSYETFYGELYSYKPGDSVKLSVYRMSANRMTSNTFDVDVTLLEDKGETQDVETKRFFE